jgi:hypothetical protein
MEQNRSKLSARCAMIFQVTALAGSIHSARFQDPRGVAVSGDGGAWCYLYGRHLEPLHSQNLPR